MSPNNITFADIESARIALKDMYPKAKLITLVEHGYDNIVGLVDETFAVRFPRNSNAYKRSQYEKAVLNSLKGFDNIFNNNIVVPTVLGERRTPPCLITSFVHGAHMSPDDINKLPRSLQEEFGKRVAQFAYELHCSLSVAEARLLRRKLGLDELEEEPWEAYFEKMLIKTTLPTPQQDALAKHYFKLWQQNNTEEGLVVVHDDLHTANMLFEDDHLVGVLDFGDTNIGTPEQELRQLYRTNEVVLQAAVKTYNQLSGLKLDVQSIIIWAITQEIAAYVAKLTANDTQHPTFVRACRNLDIWLPEGEWGTGLHLTP